MKNNQRKSRKKRGGHFFSFLLFLTILVVIIASVTMFLRTSEILVTGAEKHSAAEIIEASGLRIGDNLFAVNKFEVERKIKEQYPYIASVEIRRRLPDAFLLHVTERVPAAYLDVGEQRWILDKDAYILEQTATTETGSFLHIISESEAVEPKSGEKLVLAEEGAVNALSVVMNALSDAEVIANVGQVDITKLYQLNFIYDGRIQVQLGNIDKMDRKIRMFCTVLAELDASDRGILNVSDPTEGRFQPNSSVQIGG